MHGAVDFYPEREVDGIAGWYWIREDRGAWEGPSEDWEQSHKETIQKHCKKFRTVVQVGGNLGMYPKLLSRIFNHVYTFEPDPLNFYVLNLNCPEENIYKFQSALGAEQGFITMRRHSMENVGMHTVNPDSEGIPILALDTFRLSNVDLLMIDVEGYEQFVLEGASNLFIMNSPVVFAERPNSIVESFLFERGYKSVGKSKMDTVYVRE